MPFPKGVDIEEFKKNKLDPIRLRVFNLLKTWVSTYTYDFLEDEKLVSTMVEFIDKTMRVTGMDRAGEQLVRLINKKIAEKGNATKKELQFSKPPPKPILPMNLTNNNIRITDYDPTEACILPFISGCYAPLIVSFN